MYSTYTCQEEMPAAPKNTKPNNNDNNKTLATALLHASASLLAPAAHRRNVARQILACFPETRRQTPPSQPWKPGGVIGTSERLETTQRGVGTSGPLGGQTRAVVL